MSYETYVRRFGQPYYNGNDYMTLGESLKVKSDLIMEDSWWNDPQSKVAYIYDYFHDDQPELNYGMSYDNTTKTRIDIKYIVTEKGSLSKDTPSVKIQFKPSTKLHYSEEDDLYYLEERMKRYGATDCYIGAYIDIPNENGIYHKYMICLSDVYNNQFQKYFVLPCNYKLQWISREGNKRVKNNMWCVLRSQSSYNSGLWVDHITATRENQEILFIPTNSISDTIWYKSNDNNNNQRLIVDVPCENPNVWQVSKVEKVNVRLRTKITLYQHEFDPHMDYIEKDDDGNIIGMYADYYSSNIEPIDTNVVDSNEDDDFDSFDEFNSYDGVCELSASNNKLKIGGSYKLITASIADEDQDDEFMDYSFVTYKWSFFIDDVNVTDTDLITVLEQTDNNKIKIKFKNDKTYLGKILTVKCIASNAGASGSIDFELVSL